MCNFPPKKVEKNELLENNCTREGVGKRYYNININYSECFNEVDLLTTQEY